MILDGVYYYPVIHFCRVILYLWCSPFVVSLSLASTLLNLRVLSSSDAFIIVSVFMLLLKRPFVQSSFDMQDSHTCFFLFSFRLF